jgi:type II secretory pathway pseudopilin PulG
MKRLHGRGFTIIETLIVLAVTSAMFIVAILAFSGQQEKTRFAQANRDTESKVRDVANDVSAGYFPEVVGWNCTATGGAAPVIDEDSGSGQGTNQDCIFIGKALHFGAGDANCGNNCSDVRIVTVAGRRQAPLGGKEVTSLTDAKQVAATTNSPYNESYQLKYGMGVYRVVDGEGNPLSGVAFLSSLGSYNDSDDIVAGSQSVGLYRVGTKLESDAEQFAGDVAAIQDDDRISTATICMTNGGASGRKAALILTEQSAGISTELVVDEAVPEACNVA